MSCLQTAAIAVSPCGGSAAWSYSCTVAKYYHEREALPSIERHFINGLLFHTTDAAGWQAV